MAIEYENTPVEWQNQGTEPSEDLKKNGFQAGYKPPAQVFNYLQNNISSCLNELQTKLNELSNAVNELPGDIGDVGETVEQMQTDITNINSSIDQIQTDLTTLDGDAIKGIKGNGTTINPSSTGIINITPNNIGAAASTHYHNASQITSGTLPIERGGTGSTTAEEVRENLGVVATDLSNVDNEVFADKATSAGVGGGTVLFATDDTTTGTILGRDGSNVDHTITINVNIEDYTYIAFDAIDTDKVSQRGVLSTLFTGTTGTNNTGNYTDRKFECKKDFVVTAKNYPDLAKCEFSVNNTLRIYVLRITGYK